MVLGRAALGLISLLGSTVPPGARSFPLTSSSSSSSTTTTTTTTTTSLGSMPYDGGYYRDDYGDYPYYDYGGPPFSSPSRSSSSSTSSSTDWRRSQGYNLDRPTPPELGGTPHGIDRDMMTNPYYDPGWAQSVRRDSPSLESSYVDRRYYHYGVGRRPTTTYPGMSDPRRTDKVYTNPTNPYYDPVWSQSHARNDEPIREGDHTVYYAPGYDYARNSRNYYMNDDGGDDDYYYYDRRRRGIIGGGIGGGMGGRMYMTTNDIINKFS